MFKSIQDNRRPRRLCRRSLAAIVLISCAFPAFAQKDAESAFVERAALRAANENCQLLDDSETLALDMGYWQARGALLRGGYGLDGVDRMQYEAADYARSKDCDDEAMIGASDRLKNAFLAFSRTPYMELDGQFRQWTATRTLTDVWGVHQEDPDSGVRLGLIFLNRARDPFASADPTQPRETPVFAALLPMAKGAKPPAFVRLIMRDPTKDNHPWLGGPFGRGGGPLSVVPRGLSKQHFASERIVIDAPPYEDDGETPGALFLFDNNVQRAFENLDPREIIRIEFIPSDRAENTDRLDVIMEVGDFRASAAFSAIPRQRPQTTEIAQNDANSP